MWDKTELVTHRSAEELRREADEIRRAEEVEQELTVVLKGIAAPT